MKTMKQTDRLIFRLLSLVAFTVTVSILSSCNTSEKTIGYTEVLHYFVRNDVVDFSPRVITTEEEMRQYFGMAAVMGPRGLPTTVDFNNENVIAVVEPQTNMDTEIKIESIRKQNGQVVVTYKTIVLGEPRSYQFVPSLLVKVSKKHGNSVEFVKH